MPTSTATKANEAAAAGCQLVDVELQTRSRQPKAAGARIHPAEAVVAEPGQRDAEPVPVSDADDAERPVGAELRLGAEACDDVPERAAVDGDRGARLHLGDQVCRSRRREGAREHEEQKSPNQSTQVANRIDPVCK